MAYYSQDHVDRLRLVRELQHKRFLPLKAIKAVLDGEAADFEPDQRELLCEVKERLEQSALVGPVREHKIDVHALCREIGVTFGEVRRMAELGLVTVVTGEGNVTRLSEHDAGIVRLWGSIRALGFTHELGFTVDDLAVYGDAMAALFAHEKTRMLARVSRLTSDRVAVMVEEVLPIIHLLVARLHTTHVRNFFASME